MRIVALEVHRFACVKHASVEFARGLNLLHGPNDVGKSTLVQAMRAALLLPHSSSVYKEFVPWQEPDATPEVGLTFEILENDRPRYYRVRKRFGQSAHLDWSNDGKSFSDDTRKAREVDERLRALLQWGVPAAGSGRGMPESFLVKVLMASQPEVTGILGAALADDKDPSGKNRIMNAMEAMMEDPLFKKVLDRAVQQVNIAYSAQGRQRRNKGSPWVELRDKINDADNEVRRLQSLRDQSATVLARVRALEDEVLLADESLGSAKRHAADVAKRFKQQQELKDLEARVRAAETTLQAHTDKVAAVEQAKNGVAEGEALLAARQAAWLEAKTQVVAAKGELEATQLRLRQLQSDDAAREVELKLSRLKERQTQLQADIDAQVRVGERAQAAATKRSEVAVAEQRVQELEQESYTREKHHQKAQDDLDAARTQRERLRLVSRYQRLLTSIAQLEAADAAERDANSQRAEADKARQQADEIEATLGQTQLPDAARLTQLRALHHDLEVKQAALDLGLTAVVTPDSPPLAIEVTVDDAVSTENLFGPGRFTARESLKLKVPGATVALTASAAAQVQTLRAKWSDTGEPVLKAAGVATFAELDAAVKHAEARREECSRLRSSASEREASALRLTSQASRLPALRVSVEDERRAFDGLDLADLEQEVAKFSGETEVARAESGAERRYTELDVERAKAREALQTTTAQLQAARTHLDSAQTAYGDAATLVDGDCLETLNRVVEELSKLRALKAETDDELKEAAVSQSEDVVAAEQLLAAAERASAVALEAEEGTEQAFHAAERDLAVLRERLTMVEEAAKSVDVDTARSDFTRLHEEFSKAQAVVVAAGPMLADADVEHAGVLVEQAQAALNEKRTQCAESRGSLMEVGGNVVEEELHDASTALEQCKRELQELEVEYGAWQLLQTTLRDAEKSEATNLGEKLGGPLQSRFAQLTGGRYQHVDVDADLKTEGFTAAGDLRSVAALSSGTQEQLSTLFRLCLAEALQTTVVLDDHLSQTDSSKMLWFRDALDQVAMKSQIVVISCWPEHYQLPPGKVDTAKKIDASSVVERY